MHPLRRFSPVLFALLLLLFTGYETPARAEAAALDWTACGAFQCAKLAVPLDYARPQGRQIELALIRRQARLPAQRIGSLVVNPGGPGASGVEFLQAWIGRLDGAIRDRFDIVSFDPRGVAQSAPLMCHDDIVRLAGADATPDTPQERQQLVDVNRDFARLCAARDAERLPHLGTANVVRDLDAIRAALGEDKLTYLGYSYGTSIGAVYADRFPDRVRAIVLDGAVDLSLGFEALGIQQARGFEGALQRFLADCVVRRCLADPAADVDELIRRAEAAPIPSPSGRSAGPAEVITALFTGLYTDNTWRPLGRAVDSALKGDSTGVFTFVDDYLDRRPDGTYGNLLAMYTAVSCVDYLYPRSAEGFETVAAEASLQAPHFGAWNITALLPCAFWEAPGSPQPAPRGAGAPPILVIGTTGDPATPYQWSVSMSAQLESARLLTYFGDGHTIYTGNGCVNDIVDAYLIDLELPAPGAACGDPEKHEPFIVSDAPAAPPTGFFFPGTDEFALLRALPIVLGATVFVVAGFVVWKLRRKEPGS